MYKDPNPESTTCGILGDKGGSVTGYGRTKQHYCDLEKQIPCSSFDKTHF